MLNKTKGPAVHSLRAQIDRRRYQEEMKHTLEKQNNLHLKQAEAEEIIVENRKVCGVVTSIGAIFNTQVVILCTGTYLKGKIIVGEKSYDGGPDGMFSASKLSGGLRKNGIKLFRLKTGTPPRISSKTVDFTEMEKQDGDKDIRYFSFENEGKTVDIKQRPCYLTWTNDKTKKIIEENLHRSPLFSGDIEGIRPRYCPS